MASVTPKQSVAKDALARARNGHGAKHPLDRRAGAIISKGESPWEKSFSTRVYRWMVVAGPNDGPENGLGDGGERLHDWGFNGSVEIRLAEGHMAMKVSPQSAALLKEEVASNGAMVFGRRTFDFSHARHGHGALDLYTVAAHASVTQGGGSIRESWGQPWVGILLSNRE